MTSQQLKGTILATGAAGGIGTGWLHEHLQSEHARSHLTIYVTHPSFPGQLREILDKEGDGCRFEIVEIDLSILENVKIFTRVLSGRVESNDIPRIRLLILIAGVMFLDPTTKDGIGFTTEGFEKTWALNYAANVCLILGLLPVMSEKGRIVWLASSSHDPSFRTSRPLYTPGTVSLFKAGDGEVERFAKATDKIEEGDEVHGAVRRYAASKLSMTMFMYALQRRLSSSSSFNQIKILANSPGTVGGTSITSSMPWYVRMVMQYLLVPLQALFVLIWGNGNLRTAKVAGGDLQWCCWSTELKGGDYVDGREVITSSPESLNIKKQKCLWVGTRKLLGLKEEMTALGDGIQGGF